MEFMCLDFVNSGWYRNHERFVELLEDPEWLNIFCTKWHIPIPEHVPTTISALHDCRETLYQ
ncbi:MAG TPA: hypothetical protein DEP42_03180, partial [Ruminococcaceae bacterium]|nr:hypothetical protein [Oscillospiraceae bacterium]